jgi:hypothetical protein
MLDDLVDQQFVRLSARQLFFVETDPLAGVAQLLATSVGRVDPTHMVPSGPE